MNAEAFLKIQKALAEPKRMEIIEAIRQMSCTGEITCTHVLAHVGVAQSTFSHHISELVEAGVISAMKEGRTMRLSVREDTLGEYLSELREKLLGEV